jgi:repressor LexA
MILSNKELGKYLRDIREQLGYSIYDVNKLCDISPSYLSLMENGKRKPSAIILKKIAPIYSLNYLDLYEKAGYIDLINDEKYISTDSTPDDIYDQLKNIGTMYVSNTDMVKIPILGVVKAGYDYLAQENWIGSVDVEKNIVNDGSEYFALKVVGDSMSPVLIQDDIVVIKKQNDFENGDIVVAIVNGNEATIKKGKKTDSSITLQPLNPSYDPLVFTYDEVKSIPVTIVGIVKQLKRDF